MVGTGAAGGNDTGDDGFNTGDDTGDGEEGEFWRVEAW